MKIKFTPVFALMFFAAGAYAQTDSTGAGSNNIEDLSLEDLMNVKVISASKKAESAFDAPLSIGSISRDEIKKAGSTSIMEALRLVPGVIVREVTAGNYEVSLRGMDNLPYLAPLSAVTNSITLVMIDNRPVYNYFNGGTFWETLPVDLNDVEKIEVVRGPSSALYGPNAAAGVINIITRKPLKEGLYVVANGQVGQASAATGKGVIGNASAGYKFKKFDFIVSGNYQHRERYESGYYSWADSTKVPVNDVKVSFPNGPFRNVNGDLNSNERYPRQNVGLNKVGYNAFMNYNISEKSSISLNLGGQNSINQKAFIENLATPLSTSESRTQYADLKANINHLSAQISYMRGTQDAARGFIGYKYDFNTVDATVEYDIVYKNLSIKPGLNYRNASYDDSKYSDAAIKQGFLNGSRTLSNFAGSLRGEYKLFNEKLKLIAALRLDKYNYPDKMYVSYQFAANYKINDNNLVRLVYSRAYRGPNMYDIYNDQSLNIGVGQFANIQGNKNVNLLSIDMLEAGYRVKATESLYFDLDAFYQTSQNFSFLAGDATQVPTLSTPYYVINQSVINLPLKATQTGITLSANFIWNKLQFKPFVTIQSTQLTNVSSFRQTVASNDTNNVYSVYNTTHFGTPSAYGGVYLNYQILPKLNLNLNCYFFGNSSYLGIHQTFGEKGKIEMPGKFLLNAKVSYKIIKPLDVFINVRNLTNSTTFEFVQTDITKATFLVGGSFEF
jgi:iron complex outermembrane receptor protein